MTLAFIVYFGLMVALIALWWSAAQRATLGPALAAHSSGQAAIVSIALFTLVIGGRYNVGGDYFGYLDIYRFTSLGDRSSDVVFEPGFLWLIQMLKLFNLPDRSIIVASSFIQISLLSIWLRKHHQVSPFVIFAFITLILLDIDNVIRQGIAFFALLLALSALNERRWVMFIVWGIFAYLFHRSALIMLPLGVMMFLVPIVPITVQIAALFFSYSAVGIFTNQIISIFTIVSPIFGYADYSDVSRADLVFVKTVRSSFNLGIYLWPILDAIIIFYSRIIGKLNGSERYRIYHNVFLVAAVLQPVANAWDFLPFARALFYFTSMRIVCIGFFMHYCIVESRKPRDIIVAAGVASVLVAWLVVAILGGAAWSAPYQFS